MKRKAGPQVAVKNTLCPWAHCEGYLERSKGELSEKLHKAQHPSGMLVSNKGKDDLMGSQQWDQSQRRLGQPKITKKFKKTQCH